MGDRSRVGYTIYYTTFFVKNDRKIKEKKKILYRLGIFLHHHLIASNVTSKLTTLPCHNALTMGQLLFAPWAWAYSTLHP